MSIPVRVRAAAEAAPEVLTVSKDISRGGIYFTMPEQMESGASLEFEVMLPGEIFSGKPLQVRCRGKIVRVERPSLPGLLGVAATIERYQFVRPQ